MFSDKDRAIAELAVRQHNVFIREQALDIGFTEDQIDDRLGWGAWVRFAASAYGLAGAPISTRGRVHAATLVIPGSVASHQSAAELHEFPLVERGLVVVSRPDVRPNRTELGRIRRICDFQSNEHVVVDGIPATSPIRTVGDLAVVMREGRYLRMIDKLLIARVLTPEELGAFAVRWCRRGRRGSALLWRTARARGAGFVVTESELEQKGLAALRAGGLPEPVCQLSLPWREDKPGRVDVGYPDQRVLIEWDSRLHHLAEAEFEDDRRRDAEAIAAGWRPLRFTWKMLCKDPEWVCRTALRTLELATAELGASTRLAAG